MTGRVYRYLKGDRLNPIERACPRCEARPGEHCLDLRSANRPAMRPHKARVHL